MSRMIKVLDYAETVHRDGPQDFNPDENPSSSFAKYASGYEVYQQNGKLHRDGGPAVTWGNGDKNWYQHGELHREDGPAIEWASGSKTWYQHGELHREGGPAIEHVGGAKEWFLHGKCHRDGGPAIEREDGAMLLALRKLLQHQQHAQQVPTNGKKNTITKEWWIDDELHREDGPAIEWADGRKEWYLDGNKISEEEHALREECKVEIIQGEENE